MKKYHDATLINKDTYLYYANTNEEHLVLPAKGIVLEFPGLGGSSCLGGSIDKGSYSDERTKAFGEKGILVVYLFPGPWSWGNKGAVRMADAVLDAVADKFNIKPDAPLVACGGSMGGLGTLMFAANSRHTPSLAVAACPCVDVPDRFYCHDDFPRTYISAVASYDMELDQALQMISPMHRIADMPDIPYFICSDGEDEVFPEELCNRYVEKMLQAGYQVEYYKQPGLKHGYFEPEIRDKIHTVIEKAILG